MNLRLFIVRLCCFVALLMGTATAAYARIGEGEKEEADSTQVARPGLVKRVIDYFAKANEPSQAKRFDVSFIGGPHYSSDTKFGLGLAAAGFYRHNLRDTVTPPSTVSFFGDVSSAGFYLGGFKGMHIFPGDRFRVNYKLYFYSFMTYFWGVGYGMGHDNANKSKYKRFQSRLKADLLVRIGRHLYLGPMVSFQFVQAKGRARPELWDGRSPLSTVLGSGIQLSWDTRDDVNSTWRGLYISVEQSVFPRGLAGHATGTFGLTEARACCFQPVWRGGILAEMLHGRFSYGRVPWGMMSTVGDDNLRGYYEGRYLDRNAVDATVELRQHLLGRSGIAVWAGVGQVFGLQPWDWHHLLPNYGIGYRWEFKHRVNIRLDYGFGRNCSGFVFNINEAF